MYWLLRFARPLIARSFAPDRVHRAPDWVYALPAPGGDGGRCVLVFCPTFVTADNGRHQLTVIDGIVKQVRTLSPANRRHSLCFVVGVQHDPVQAGEAKRRLRGFAEICHKAGVPFAGFALEQWGKTRSLNVALEAARAMPATALLQIDDDVYLEAGCLSHLLDEYEAADGEVVVGATKIGIARRSKTSRSLRWLRSQTGHSCDYPHGCCLVFNPWRLPPAIPGEFVSDDGFICFSSIRPAAPNPMALLRLSSSARCRYFVGGTPWQSAKRIRRMLLNAHLLMAGFPAPTAEYFYRNLLFKGLWPIGCSTEGVSPRAVGRWLLRFAYFWIFAAIGTELVVRGTLRRPLREIPWAGVRHRAVPVPAGERTRPDPRR